MIFYKKLVYIVKVRINVNNVEQLIDLIENREYNKIEVFNNYMIVYLNRKLSVKLINYEDFIKIEIDNIMKNTDMVYKVYKTTSFYKKLNKLFIRHMDEEKENICTYTNISNAILSKVLSRLLER